MTDSPMDEILRRDLYPDWVSDKALSVLKYYLQLFLFDSSGYIFEDLYDENDPEHPKIKQTEKHFLPYISCFHSNKMEYCWNKISGSRFIDELEENNRYFSRKGADAKEWFAEALWSSLPHIRQKPKTASQSEAWKEQTMRALISARDLAGSMPVEMGGWFHPTNKRVMRLLQEDNPAISEMDLHFHRHPMDFLDSMISALENVEYDSLFYRGSVNGVDAQRTYFIRSLTCALLQDFGTPMVKLVSIAATVAFGRETTEDHVNRTKRGIDPNGFMPVVLRCDWGPKRHPGFPWSL